MGWKNVDMTRGAYVFTRGKMPKSREDRLSRAVWTIDSGTIYINCAGCGGIVPIGGDSKVLGSGFVENCCVCKCGSHIWICLDDWDKADPEVKERYRFSLGAVMRHGHS